MRILPVILFVVALGCGAGWYARRESLRACRAGAGALRASTKAVGWVEEASRDRFFAAFLRTGPAAEALREIRLRATVAAGEPISWHLGPEAKAALAGLWASPLETNFLPNLRAAGKVALPTECNFADVHLEEMVTAGEIYWHSRRTEVRMAKLNFARDREIFCQSEALNSRLKAVLNATEAKCAASRKGCTPKATAPIRQEMEDIEMQKEFNRQKLQRKWPAEILEGLSCS